MIRSALPVVCAVGIAITASPIRAHDFWIEPSNYRPGPGDRVDVTLRVGDGFRGEAFPRDPTHLERFFIDGPEGRHAVPGLPGRDPAGAFRIGERTAHAIAYTSRPQYVELDSATFDAYLHEKGLTSILAERKRHAEHTSRARELYSRHAKSLLTTSGGEPGSDRSLGLTLEIVLTGPRSTTPAIGDDLSFDVFYEDAPLENALVIATSSEDSRIVRSARTDGNGRVTLSLDRSGAWLLSTVHMVQAARDTGVDWRSFWASLTFDR